MYQLSRPPPTLLLTAAVCIRKGFYEVTVGGAALVLLKNIALFFHEIAILKTSFYSVLMADQHVFVVFISCQQSICLISAHQ